MTLKLKKLSADLAHQLLVRRTMTWEETGDLWALARRERTLRARIDRILPDEVLGNIPVAYRR